jgi:polysaccharide chain length determinant protein (PEP-CTERM system associated)
MEDLEYTSKDVLAIVKRRKTAFLIPFALIFLLSGTIALLLPAVYKSTATILIEQREIPAAYVTSSITTFAEQRMQSIQQRILTSSKLLELIKQFSLYTNLEKRKTREEIIDKMRKDIHLVPINVDIADRRSGRTATATIAFSLSYECEFAKKAQQVTGTITSLFLSEDLKVRKNQASSAHDFLMAEKEKIRTRINEVEKRIALFKQENALSLPELFQMNQRSLDDTLTRIERSKENLRALKEKKEELEDQLTHTEQYLEDTESRKNQKNQDVQRLEQVKIQLINLKTQYSDLYPDVKKLNQEISDLSEKVADKTDDPKDKQKNPAYITLSSRLAGMASDIESVKNQILDQEKKAEEYRERMSKTPMVEETYNAILSERKNLYIKDTDLQAKMMEASVAQEFESKQKGERFTLIEAARMPEKPYKPNRLAIVLVGLFLGLGLGAGMVALAEFSDSSFRTGESLSMASNFPVLAEIPVIETAKDKHKKKIKRRVILAVIFLALAGGVLLFHWYVMDIDVLRAKLVRKFF